VKCDEGKPACHRCTSTGRKCDGYAQNISGLRTRDDHSLALEQKISRHMPGTTEEKRSFSYFLHTTSAELSGYFDPSFWQQLLPQASAVEPALRHAIVGIGSLHEAFVNKRLDNSSGSTERGFAMTQYTKAIGHLRRSLAKDTQEPLTALMACILFVCFESICGQFESAIVRPRSTISKYVSNLQARSICKAV
jgi:hypothetical protein